MSKFVDNKTEYRQNINYRLEKGFVPILKAESTGRSCFWNIETSNHHGPFVQHHKIQVVYSGTLPAVKSGVFLILEKLLSCHPYLPGLVHGFLRIALHLIAGMVCYLCDGLFEDGSRLSDRQRRVQIRLALKISNKMREKQNKTKAQKYFQFAKMPLQP